MNSTGDLAAALPPPSGVTSNFVNPAFNGQKIIVVGIIFPIFTIPFVAARLYSKAYLMKRLHLDDYMIIMAVPFTLAFSILQMYQTKHGTGNHMWDITWATFKRNTLISWILGPFFYGIGTMFIKSSILFFYLRFPSERPFKIVTYTILFIVCFYSLFGAFTFLFMCRPVQSYWDLDVPGKCLNSKLLFLVAGALNVATDLTMLLLPIWLLKPLRLPRKQKIGVTLILMAGSFVVIVSTIRLSNIPPAVVNPDFTWIGTIGFVWIIVEMYTGIICACLPSLRTIIKYHYPSPREFNPRFSTAPFPTDDLQFSRHAQAQQEQNRSANPCDERQSWSSESGKAGSGVQLHSVNSYHGSTTEDPEQGHSTHSVQLPQKAFLGRDTANTVP